MVKLDKPFQIVQSSCIKPFSSSVMDRTVLLLLCLQFFLLITAFTSTDAAALVTDDQQQQQPLGPVEGVSVHNRGKSRQKRGVRNCSVWTGGCAVARSPNSFETGTGTEIKEIPSTADPPVQIQTDLKKMAQARHEN